MQQKADASDEKENDFSSNSYDDARKAESEQILARIKLESGSGVKTALARGYNKGRDHIKARDSDSDDPVEVWATRVGRALGLFIMVAMIVWLIFYVMQG